MPYPFDPTHVADVLRRRAATAASTPGTSPWKAYGMRDAANAVERGQMLTRATRGLGLATGWGLRTAGRAANAVLAPVGGGLMRAAGHAAEGLYNNPGLATAVGTAAVLGPMIVSDLGAEANNQRNQIDAARADPERVLGRDVTASLNTFLEKKAALSWDGVRNYLGDHAMPKITGGLAEGLGKEIGAALVYGASRLIGGAQNSLVTDPQRKQLLSKLLQTDSVISEAVARNPAMLENLAQAFQTFVKFAPTLSTDLNAVRSYLREVVLGGGHVNYATIKNLIETEKALHGDVPKYKGVF